MLWSPCQEVVGKWQNFCVDGRLLNSQLLAQAYREGWFPMADDTGEITWYKSRNRALFHLSGIRISRSLRRTLNSGKFQVTFDQDFEGVMRGCLRPGDNWINEDIIRAFCEAHQEGWGHSCEVWREGWLVGGIYGLAVGLCFSAESMFHRETDASKVALHHMTTRCRELGFTIFDAQIMNPHLESLGAYEVADAEYDSLLQQAVMNKTRWSL